MKKTINVRYNEKIRVVGIYTHKKLPSSFYPRLNRKNDNVRYFFIWIMKNSFCMACMLCSTVRFSLKSEKITLCTLWAVVCMYMLKKCLAFVQLNATYNGIRSNFSFLEFRSLLSNVLIEWAGIFYGSIILCIC